jgi:hypothetical protein
MDWRNRSVKHDFGFARAEKGVAVPWLLVDPK